MKLVTKERESAVKPYKNTSVVPGIKNYIAESRSQQNNANKFVSFVVYVAKFFSPFLRRPLELKWEETFL